VTEKKVTNALPALEEIARQTLQKTGVPGMAIAVVYKDRVVYLKGFGFRQAGAAGPVDEDTVFLLASVSKPITATLLALLVGEGRIAWDDRLIDRYPDFRLFDPWATREVTLRDLLCHRSGLPAHAGDLLEDLGYGRAEVLHRLRYLRPSSSFRAKYAYTNFGYTAAAVAAARAAGHSWEDLAAARLFRPLGMTSSSYRFRDYAAAANRALLHVRVGGRWVARYVRDPDAQSPAGGASSTGRDLAQWMRLQLCGGMFNGKRLVSEAALAETHRPQIVSGPPANPTTDRAGFYGLGWNVSYDGQGRVRLGHSGGFDLGAATVVQLLPSEGLGIAVLTNAAPIGVPETVAASFCDRVLYGKVEKDWADTFLRAFAELAKPAYGTAVDYGMPPARKSPPLPLAAYAGTYGNAYFGDLEVIERGGALQLRLGPRHTAYPLRHWDRDVFLYQPAGEMAGGPSGVNFLVGPDRRGVRVVVEDLDLQGQGTFTRLTEKK
jgi:CubicO group peptidase (beta-lactamase class C family)